ncbi:MAG: O-antigen ligase family protein [Thiobacillaceae bacterium]
MKNRSIFSLALLCGLVVSALMHTGHVFSYDLHRMVQVVVLVMVGVLMVWLPQSVLTGLSALGRRHAWLMGTAFALGALSSVFAARPHFAGLEWALFFLLFVLVLAVSQEAYRHPEQFDRWMRWVLAAVAVIVFLKIMLVYLVALLKGAMLDSAALFYPGFSNRRFFGQIATLIIPLLAYPLLIAQGSRERFFWRVMLALWWALLLASATRGSFMALLVASIVLLVLNRQKTLPWLKTQAACLGLGVVIYGVVFIWLPEQLNQAVSMESRVNDFSSLSNRDVIWRIALHHITAHPLLGIGPMHFANEMNPVAAHPHNALLQLAAEWGTPAALAWLIVAMTSCWAFLKRIQTGGTQDWLGTSLAVALLGAAAQSMVDGMIVVPYTQLWLVAVIAWAIGVYLRGSTSFLLGNSSIAIFRLLIALTIGLLVWGVYPEMFNIQELASKYRMAMVPRFWAQGWLEYY